ncbi:MAG: hypothetical protein COZ16_12080 [Flavobacteriaceae bacterium CG_4_10_14_3_um_filter_31_253]|nr:MAG: hypothetical protein AUK46_06780 [Flavobacteriaceae bacterium CG2_30_31_66]PIV96594.1 MAG: hypothetical protein COW43_07495 [Flavobacteriaceae bacterium CG17_big_fil_post_rev_8_21_14_2_50_31_13]PIX13971.1 MAG: hypothetical protein COZ74_04290 [Flavobacteriaceae bacterium CG_4_8_14_3_um_filter_31_8]PIY13880.1 MAG: hypothetical protein COZ16_12080 [Flavobacteriaceae bacterium CG_4_10_14_3_um_filter_31_253]PIZ10581.1 MAG: hypothetical protein COY55_08020 [Flavobacteriaceae bacterium CG_4_1
MQEIFKPFRKNTANCVFENLLIFFFLYIKKTDMLKNIFYPTSQTIFIWLSTIYLFFLLYLGKISPLTVLFVYFLETIIIGIFNALKMFCTIKLGNSSGYGTIVFFLFHYGFFVAIQSIFAFAIFSIGDTIVFKEPFHLIDNYSIILNLADILYALPAIIFTHVGKFFTDFIGHQKYLKFDIQEIMFSPYVRIFIQQFVVILSSFFIIISESGIFAAILLILLRFFIDLVMEAIKEKSEMLDFVSEKLSNEKASKETIKKQLINFTE